MPRKIVVCADDDSLILRATNLISQKDLGVECIAVNVEGGLCEQNVEKCKRADAVLVFCCNRQDEKRIAATLLNCGLRLYAQVKMYADRNLIAVSNAYCEISKRESGFRNNSTFGREAFDTISCSELEIERVARIAYELAEKERKGLLLVDRADRLETSKLWRKIVADLNEDYPSVAVDAKLCQDAVVNFDGIRNCVVLSSNMIDAILDALASKTCPFVGALLGDTAQGVYIASEEKDLQKACEFMFENSLGI